MKHAGWASLLLILAAGTGRAQNQDPPLLLQRPTISRTHIAFGFGGDLWIVDRDGGDARRLTSDAGLEFGPIFSPDGSRIAFTGEYDGNVDVFVVSAAGGEPRRLTVHPGIDIAVSWTPDGTSIVFSSARASITPRFNKLFTLPVEGGGFPAELPLPMGEEGAISPDGGRIAYVPFWNRRALPNAYIAWKRYRGGKASPVWIADLADSRITKVPREDSNDCCPLWVGGKVYFVSDRAVPATLFSYDPESKQVRKELENSGYDVLSASAGPDLIVTEQFGSLHTFDPATRRSRKIDVRVTGDFPGTRPRFEKVGKKIVRMAVSPSGARVAVEVHGEILTQPAEKGDVRNLTQTPGAAERNPAWSPDGKTLAYFSDESGEYQLHLRDGRGSGEIRRIALGDAPNFYFNPAWAPDGKRISYSDNRQQLWILDVATGQSTRVDAHTYFSGPDFDAAWSPDGRWLAYTKVLNNRLRAAFLHDATAGTSSPVTDGMSDVRSLAFDRSGKYLYFTASTDIGPTTNGIDMSGMNRPVTRSVYLAVLNKDLPSPLAPESDEEKDKEKPAEKDKPAEKKEDKEAATRIDLENIGQRILALSLPARNYGSLHAGKAGSLFIVERPLLPQPAAPDQPARGELSVQKFDLTTRKADKVIDGVSSFEPTASGEKMLVQQGGRWFITAAVAAAKLGDGALKTDDLEVRIEPRAEWRQMYREAWRLQRDFLYDRNAHGLDLAAAEKRYAVFLDGIVHRTDLNYLFNEMLGQMVLGHTYISGGDTPEVRRVKGGLLGADLRIENGRYRFARIYSGENWNPQLRAPLTQPGVNVREGEYLLAVGGRELKSADNLYGAFEATAGKAVVLRVGPAADGKDARDVTVVPVESEVPLRNLAWIESNRRKVGELSKGRVAYVYLPDTGTGGFANFNRYFFAQVDKEALVIDERFNGGGKAADYIIDYLRRPLLNYWAARDGRLYTTPGGAIFGPKVMIVNEFAGSGGDAMPWYFRKAGVGTLVGKRTWGGLVGISGYPPLLDGGSVTAPSFAFFSPDGTWDVENRGVAPDVEVEHDPQLVRAGREPQLEKAVEIVLKKLAENPNPEPRKPAYPNYHKQ